MRTILVSTRTLHDPANKSDSKSVSDLLTCLFIAGYELQTTCLFIRALLAGKGVAGDARGPAFDVWLRVSP